MIHTLKTIYEELDRFNNVKFNPATHTYTINGKELISVTKLISKFHKEFDKEN